MSATERFFVAYNELRPPFVIQLAVEGDGALDPEHVQDALERATAANPGSSLVLDESGPEPMWILGPEPTLTLVDAPSWRGDREGEELLLWPMSTKTGPTCELVLVTGAHKTYLLFRALHAVMDGQGTLAWAKDVMRCLRGEAPIGHPSTLTSDQIVFEGDKDKRASPAEDALHPFGRASAESAGRFLWRRFTSDRPLDATATGRVAVGLAAEARRHGEGTVRVNLPTDLRHHRRGERTTGNLFSSLFIDVPADATAEMIGLKVMQLLYRKEGTKPVGMYAAKKQVGSLSAHRAKCLWDMAHLHDTGRYAFSFTLSHLGALDGASLSCAGFAATGAFFVPLVGDSGCVLSLNGFDARTECCVGLSDRFGGEASVERLAEIVKAALADD